MTPADQYAPFLTIAREAIASALQGLLYEPPVVSNIIDAPRGVFVTLRKPDGELRGCIGHIRPRYDKLSKEVAEVAVLSAVADHRFKRLSLEEFLQTDIEISILEPLESVKDKNELDPKVFGVVVQTPRNQGVLLPDIAGIDTVDQQLEVVRHKAGISAQENITMQRFRVSKLCEA